jgi:hypothetical protein
VSEPGNSIATGRRIDLHAFPFTEARIVHQNGGSRGAITVDAIACDVQPRPSGEEDFDPRFDVSVGRRIDVCQNHVRTVLDVEGLREHPGEERVLIPGLGSSVGDPVKGEKESQWTQGVQALHITPPWLSCNLRGGLRGEVIGNQMFGLYHDLTS